MTNKPIWPRIKDLPEREREAFNYYLRRSTRPIIEGLPMPEQDGYYPWDYDDFKAGRPVTD